VDKWTQGESVDTADQVKPSRWYTVYHIWAGMCVKLFSDVSGLSKLLLGASKGSDPSSAFTHATTAAVIAVGLVTLGYFGSKSLLKGIEASALSQRAKIVAKSILPIVYLLGAVLLAVAVSLLISAPPISRTSSIPAPDSDTMAPVLVFDTVQSAEGVTEADLDQSGLKNLETWIVNTILEKGRAKFAKLGHDPSCFKPSISANSVYIDVGGKRLAVIKVQMDNSVRSVTVLGIKGPELHRVSCLRSSNHDIPVWRGECGSKVRQVFGVSVQP
jgi:hypothetical protein